MAEQMTFNREALWEKIQYHPHPRQVLFHDSKARFRVAASGRRFGKSRMAAAEAEPELFRTHADGSPTKGWIIGPTYTLGEKEFAYMWEDIVMKLGLGPHLKRKAYNIKTGDMYIEMPWGSRVDVKSADHPDGLVGEGLDWVIISEAAKQKEAVWEKYVRPSLADYNGWAIFPSTPEGQNWFYKAYLKGQPWHESYSPTWESWNFPSWENPYVYPGGFEDPEIQDQMRSPNDPWFWQEIGADFRSFVGKIYTEWDDNIHIIPEWEYNPYWDSYLFFDFGFTNPFVALDVQVSPTDDIYIWREYYKSGMPTHKHAMELRNRSNPEGYALRAGYGDAADPASLEELSTILVPTFGEPESKDWVTGIQVVKKFLMGKDGNPHLYVHRSCTNTIWEFQNYRTKQNTKGDENPKEDPKKWADHSMDAIRYGLMHLFELGAKHHLSEVYSPPERTSPLVGVRSMGDVPEPADTFFGGYTDNFTLDGGGLDF